MYRLVDESESHRYRSYCARVLTETCEMLREEGINAQFVLVGSGARNLITRNGDGPYDLDYNLVIIAADPFYILVRSNTNPGRLFCPESTNQR